MKDYPYMQPLVDNTYLIEFKNKNGKIISVILTQKEALDVEGLISMIVPRMKK